MSAAFCLEMERLFGTEEALGISFVCEDGRKLTIEEHDNMFAALGKDMPSCYSVFANGASAICCTNYAAYIYHTLARIYEAVPNRVEIFGFTNENNPSSRIAKEKIHPGGHDFAIVDERYIVDPWIRLVAMKSEQMVFNLADPDQNLLITDIYGPHYLWVPNKQGHLYAFKQGLKG